MSAWSFRACAMHPAIIKGGKGRGKDEERRGREEREKGWKGRNVAPSLTFSPGSASAGTYF